MEDFTKICKIYIIESQNPIDILENRNEGKALSAGLDLAGIKNNYYQVINEGALDLCFRQIAEDILELQPQNLVAPYIHISAHGSESGIKLSNNELLSWNQLTPKIDSLNARIGMIHPNKSHPELEYSALHFCFSTCKGAYGHLLQGESEGNKFSTMVGPKDSIEWIDSLLAFMSFYHQIIYKKNTAENAVSIMNTITGLNDMFQLKLGEGLELKK